MTLHMQSRLVFLETRRCAEPFGGPRVIAHALSTGLDAVHLVVAVTMRDIRAHLRAHSERNGK